MPLLPQHLHKTIRIGWHSTDWCNYRCEYCPAPVFHQRSKSGRKQDHAFDHHSPAEWLEAFRLFQYDDIYLTIGGGEPFLDRRNLHELLAGLLALPNFHTSLNTNGFWNPDDYSDLPTSRAWLTVSYHPMQVGFEKYLSNLRRIRAAGFRVAVVNIVLAPENLEAVEPAVQALEADGFFVTPWPMISTGLYCSRKRRSERELDLIERYNTQCDTYFVVVNPPTKGSLCFYPAMSYDLWPDGRIQVSCLDGTARDMFTQGAPPLPREAVPCERNYCVGCADMVRSIVGAPFVTAPLDFCEKDASREFIEEVLSYRARYHKEAARRSLPLGLDRVFGRTKLIGFARAMAKQVAFSKPPVVSLSPEAARVPEQAIFGHTDQAEIAARGGDRISVSGWAASRDPERPVREVRMTVGGREIGIIRDFEARPEVATTYCRADLLECGWRGMLHLPALPRGEYSLIPEACDGEGRAAKLPPVILRIDD
jgi:organic radical activating enzyme